MRIVTLSSQPNRGMISVKRNSVKNRKAALMNAKATLAIEGIHLTEQEEKLLLARANGELKYSEFLAQALEMAKNV